MSPDDVVSYNLRQARDLRGWTQPAAAARVSRYLGREMSAQVYGDAERAFRVGRVKEFSAEEIAAFSRAFDLPLIWFYLPPSLSVKIVPRNADESGPDASLTGGELLGLIFPRLDDPGLELLEQRTNRLFNEAAALGPTRQNLGAYLDWIQRQRITLRKLIIAELESLDRIPDQLEHHASQIRGVLQIVASEMMHEGIPVADAPRESNGDDE